MASFTQKLIISLILLVVLLANFAALGGSLDILEFDLALIASLSQHMADLSPWQRILVASVVVIATLCTAYAMWATWYGSSADKSGYIIGDNKTGNARIDKKSVNKSAESFILELEGIQSVRCFSHNTRRGVRIYCTVSIDSDTSVAQLAERIQNETQEWLEEHTGITVETVKTIIRIAQNN